ncbi:TetR/AcrR family transcriptional regulator [Prescottella equi]|uniref:TetR/AcrR family transcriptional regulator n=1 Tax=Rhodococcus hoagii TaxID=43767 RepID=UPI001F319F60|nr:TetR/AcrR family transcriptional regulator [Prescottella equi]
MSPSLQLRKPTPTDVASPAERLLAAATELFAANGIRAVGIDRILAESGVAKASLYSSYGSKDGLVHAYLEALDLRDRTRWEGAVADVAAPLDRVLAFFDLAAASAPVRNFRGCQYLNAATEFPGDEVPMLAPVQAHREWVLARIVENLVAAAVPDAEAVAARVQLIYDGALAGSKFTHSEEPIHLGRRMAEELLRPTRN